MNSVAPNKHALALPINSSGRAGCRHCHRQKQWHARREQQPCEFHPRRANKPFRLSVNFIAHAVYNICCTQQLVDFQRARAAWQTRWRGACDIAVLPPRRRAPPLAGAAGTFCRRAFSAAHARRPIRVARPLFIGSVFNSDMKTRPPQLREKESGRVRSPRVSIEFSALPTKNGCGSICHRKVRKSRARRRVSSCVYPAGYRWCQKAYANSLHWMWTSLAFHSSFV